MSRIDAEAWPYAGERSAPDCGSAQGASAALPGADLVASVREVIGRTLASGQCNVHRVAEVFSIHRVTLHRQLSSRSTTFAQLLEEARRDLAQRMLEQTDRRVGEIALALGYGSAGSFVRAYRRWFGTTPGACRRRRPLRPRAGGPPPEMRGD